MQYVLGLRNRKRYITDQKFLSEKFDPHELLIYSSNTNSTISSVSCQLQGIYPQISEGGEILTKEQEELSYPPVNVDYDYINNEIKNLNRSALPHRMMLAPIKMINDKERKILVYDIEGCTDKRDEVKKKNRENIPLLTEVVDNFNDKYGEKVNKLQGTDSKKYDIVFIEQFCDTFFSDNTDTRDLTEFKKTDINIEELENYCLDYASKNFFYHYFGDEEKLLPHVESSKIMKEFIHYMKQRIDADIKEENIEEQYKDYSRPKMLMISGYDSTVSSDEVFLMNAFGLNSSLYEFPKFASQMALEVTSKDDGQKKKDYSDYFVNYYLDDNHKFNVTAKEFIEKLEKQIWSDEQINQFCGWDNKDGNTNNNNGTNDGTDNGTTNNNDTIPKSKDKAKTAYKVLMSVFICTSAILLATTIVLGYKLFKKNSVSYPMVNQTTNTTM